MRSQVLLVTCIIVYLESKILILSLSFVTIWDLLLLISVGIWDHWSFLWNIHLRIDTTVTVLMLLIICLTPEDIWLASQWLIDCLNMLLSIHRLCLTSLVWCHFLGQLHRCTTGGLLDGFLTCLDQFLIDFLNVGVEWHLAWMIARVLGAQVAGADGVLCGSWHTSTHTLHHHWHMRGASQCHLIVCLLFIRVLESCLGVLFEVLSIYFWVFGILIR